MKDLYRSSQSIFTIVKKKISMIWNAQELRIWVAHLRILSTWLKKMKCTKMKDLGAYLRISSPWLKKILDFDDLKCPRMKDLNHLSQNIFTMVIENFWIRIIWNFQKWRIWITYLRITSPWLEKILNFDDLKFPRIKDLKHLSHRIFTII